MLFNYPIDFAINKLVGKAADKITFVRNKRHSKRIWHFIIFLAFLLILLLVWLILYYIIE